VHRRSSRSIERRSRFEGDAQVALAVEWRLEVRDAARRGTAHASRRRMLDRAAPFVGAWALLLGAAEAVAPLRVRTRPRRRRWLRNAAWAVAAGVVERGLVVTLMTQVAGRFGGRRRGLLGRAPPAVRAIAGFVLLDCGMYLWHRANHRVPLLFRFHAMHHVDPDLDTTTAARFHPIELLFSVPVRCAQVAFLGVTKETVLAHEVALQIATLFHHTNVRLPPAVDDLLALVVVTPRMHGIHHSDRPGELDSNWGTIASVWDRIFGTIRLDVDQASITIGVPAGATR
jgi:sterol desaturase/sphingolipid hydroxylase (fatty acid hydroxylase superfamily)